MDLTNILFQLKNLYQLVCEIIGNSGWTWDDKNGACIDASSSGVWDAWVKNRRNAAPFRNAGWAHLEAFRTLIPQSIPRGSHVFRPHSVPSHPLLLSSQPDEDEDDYDGREGSQDWDIAKPFDNKDDSGDDSDDVEKENEVRNHSLCLYS
jgi:hypothetical protein